MKKILNLLLVLGLCVGLVGCSNKISKDASQDNTKTSDKGSKEDNSENDSKKVNLVDYPKVDLAINEFMNDFKTINALTEKPVALVHENTELNIAYNTLSIDYTCSEITVTFEYDLNGSLLFFSITSQSRKKDEAYLSAITTALMLNIFEFNEKNRSDIAQMIAKDEISFETSKYTISNVTTDSLVTFIITKR